MAMAQGEYLAFVDSDDFWLPDKLTLQYQMIEQNKGAGLVFSNFSTFGDNGAVLLARHRIPTDLRGSVYPRLLQIKNNVVVTPSVVARRDLIADLGGFDETMRVCEDIDLWNRCSRRAPVIFVDRALTAIQVRTEPFAYETSVRARIGLYKKAAALDPGLPGQFLMELYLEVLDFYEEFSRYRQDLEVSRILRTARERVDSMKSWMLSNEAEQIFACTLRDLAGLESAPRETLAQGPSKGDAPVARTVAAVAEQEAPRARLEAEFAQTNHYLRAEKEGRLFPSLTLPNHST